MISLDGVAYFPFLILVADQEPVLGLDPRCLQEVEREWLAKAARGARRMAALERLAIRAGMSNEVLLHRRAEGDPVLHPEGVTPGDRVELDEVAEPPVVAPDGDEVLRLCGLPDGYGGCAILAMRVVGVCRAWGDQADDICEVVEERKMRTSGMKKKARRRK